MPKKGLNREIIVEAAVRLIEQRGIPGLSMRELADTLDVKAASLYNHITGKKPGILCRIDRLAIYIFITVRRITYLICSVSESLLNTPGTVF